MRREEKPNQRVVSSPPHDETPRWTLRKWLSSGTLLGIFSAVCYTAANIALRQLADRSDTDWAIWVSCVKAVPAAVTAWVLIALRAWQGLPALPPSRLVLPLVATGLVMQFVGNVAFQWALSMGGLALTIPLSFAAIIASGAVLGRIVLGDAITIRILGSMLMMLAAIVTLGIGAEAAAVAGGKSWLVVTAGVIAACAAGTAYGSCGVMIRRTVMADISLSATLVLLSTTGVIALGVTSWLRLGTDRLLQTTPLEFTTMLTAGVFNALAFFSLTAALRYISVTQVNLLNTSQIAMASLAGVLYFGERLTPTLILGTLLTATGILLIEKPDPPCREDH